MDFENALMMILKLFYLAGLLQGGILMAALLKKRILKFQANKILLAVLVSITIILGFVLARLTNTVDIPPVLDPVAVLNWFWVSPLFYLYVQAVYDKEFAVQWKQWGYFVFPIYYLYEAIMQWSNLPLGVQNLFVDWNDYTFLLSVLFTIHTLTLCFLSIRFLLRHTDSYARFLRRFFYAFGIAAILIFVDGLFMVYGRHVIYVQRLLIVFFSGFVQYIGLITIRNSSHWRGVEQKYQNVRIDRGEQQQLIEDLESAMINEKLYLNPDLSLPELANKLEVKENVLSKLFNEDLGTGFYEYLRKYRLIEFENKLKEPKFRNQKIAAVALDSGFKSRTTFYQAFKEKHGKSPSDYLKNLSLDA